jgi:hypothetical protein
VRNRPCWRCAEILKLFDFSFAKGWEDDVQVLQGGEDSLFLVNLRQVH